MAEVEPKTERAERPRLSAADWEQAALDLIAEQGLAAVAVEPLARRLNVTKGSFYWHFASRDALIEAALKRWEQADVEGLMRHVDPIEDPRERLTQLFLRTSHEMRTHVIYSALLNTLDHPAVQPVMQRLSLRRINYLAVAYRALGLSRREAMHRARLAYSAYVGFLQLMLQLKLPRMDSEDFEGYVAHVVAALIPSAAV
ncbi:MAG TPA: helix-turn-helix domain-containing protein [Candidatus Saccharimonadia bacterium]|nr:helix-turn-helix domain-containing protein [Candidatus Saccharimonadia bacterium]